MRAAYRELYYSGMVRIELLWGAVIRLSPLTIFDLCRLAPCVAALLPACSMAFFLEVCNTTLRQIWTGTPPPHRAAGLSRSNTSPFEHAARCASSFTLPRAVDAPVRLTHDTRTELRCAPVAVASWLWPLPSESKPHLPCSAVRVGAARSFFAVVVTKVLRQSRGEGQRALVERQVPLEKVKRVCTPSSPPPSPVRTLLPPPLLPSSPPRPCRPPHSRVHLHRICTSTEHA